MSGPRLHVMEPFGDNSRYRGADLAVGIGMAAHDANNGNWGKVGVAVGSELFGRAWESILTPFGNVGQSIAASLSKAAEWIYSQPGGPSIDLSSDGLPTD